MSHARRLQRELQKMHQDVPVPGITMVSTENFTQWQMDIEVLDQNPIYHGKIFRLNFKFTENYPIEAPEVMFVRAIDREIPMHPHIYSNGVICLDLLSSGNGWSPVQSVESVCMSIQSMLTGNTKNDPMVTNSSFLALEGPLGTLDLCMTILQFDTLTKL